MTTYVDAAWWYILLYRLNNTAEYKDGRKGRKDDNACAETVFT